MAPSFFLQNIFPSLRPKIFFYFASIFILFLTLISSVFSCGAQIFEKCISSDSCAPGHICIGRNIDQLLVSCPSPNTPQCFCAPKGNFIDCKADSDCPRFQGCGVSPRTNRKLCVGCRALLDSQRNYKRVDLKSKKCETEIRPPCGATLDFCSNSSPCAPHLKCVDRITNDKAFLCSSGSSTACRCEPARGQQFFTPCALTKYSTSSCPSRETCTYASVTNVNVCLSCEVAKFEIFFKAFHTACQNIPPRPLPIYPRSPNGLTYDLCKTDLTCTEKRTCRQFKNVRNPIQGTETCNSFNNLCFCVPPTAQTCQKGQDCTKGETCATVPRIGVYKKCVSLALLESIPNGEFEVFFPVEEKKNGFRVTGDKCKFDWECREPRRCTHFSDKFGGCAGREACSCEPLRRKTCFTDSNCDREEKCVKYVDGKTRPFCLSTAVVSNDPNLQGPSFTRPAHTPVPGSGLTGDPCIKQSDCQGKRSCQHGNEIAGGCNNRAYCFCQAEKDNLCKMSDDCPEGEVCTVIKDSFPARPECMSREAFFKKRNKLLLIEVGGKE